MGDFGRIWRRAAALAFAGGLAACAPLATGPAAEGEAEVAAVAGDCGAAQFQGLVGTSIGDLDASMLPENRRVIFPGMMVTQDFLPNRLNVEVGADDRITRIYCG